jgi:hypothetical protein
MTTPWGFVDNLAYCALDLLQSCGHASRLSHLGRLRLIHALLRGVASALALRAGRFAIALELQ